MSAGEGFFVDSNLLLYSVDPTDANKRARASEWIDHLWKEGSGRLSWQVLTEFYWNSVRKMGLKPEGIRDRLVELVNWQPVDTSLGLIQRAWHWVDAAELAYWDALIVAAAECSGARYLLSEDFQSGRVFDGVQVLNPFEHAVSEFAQNV